MLAIDHKWLKVRAKKDEYVLLEKAMLGWKSSTRSTVKSN
jgi:hypothetical protein